MEDDGRRTLGRRELLVRAAPACAMGCLGLGAIQELLAEQVAAPVQEVHKFDRERDAKLSVRTAYRMQYSQFFDLVRDLRTTLGDEELIRLLKIHSTSVGRNAGESQARNATDNSFQTFVATFRPPRYANTLTHEVVEDTEGAFQLRVTECIWAEVFREAGLDGAIGHAAVCNMDYTWPAAFNPRFRMERTKTLMQGDDHCNHRYLRSAEEP
jgi:predicted ArsR family transcriptional regulator